MSEKDTEADMERNLNELTSGEACQLLILLNCHRCTGTTKGDIEEVNSDSTKKLLLNDANI